MVSIVSAYISLQIAVVAWFDFRTKKISNIWPLTNLLFFIVLPFIWPSTYQHHLEVWFVPLAFLVVGFVLFKLDVMGAGDSKYLFSLFLLVPQPHHEELLMCLLMVTVIVGGTLLLWRVITRWQEFYRLIITRVGSLKDFLGGKFTYGPVIFAAWVWFLYEVGLL